jgi:SDR family mycofactocin-dependent oxidoreductase
MRRFEGRVVLVTGGARGLGRSHALAFAHEGASVAICDVARSAPADAYALSTETDLEETVREIESTGAPCLASQTDVRDAAGLRQFVSDIEERFGRVDILCANAGKTNFGHCTDITDEVWAEVIGVNLTGVFNSVRAVLPDMLERRTGRIVVMGSSAARMGLAGESAYTAAKWGVIGFVKSVALEVAEAGITVNAVCPTVVNTRLIHNDAHYRLFRPDLESPTLQDVLEPMRTQHPQGIAWLEPAEVSEAVLYLASDAAKHITGETLSITAGLSAQNVG